MNAKIWLLAFVIMSLCLLSLVQVGLTSAQEESTPTPALPIKVTPPPEMPPAYTPGSSLPSSSPVPARVGPAAVPNTPSDLQIGGFPGGKIRLAWQDNASNETGFHIERSKDMNGFYTLLTTAAPNTTVYTDATVQPDVTYWCRIAAYNNDGLSAYSNESYNVAFAADAVPNFDEQYLLVLINEARADPAAYGYPSYSPRPPVVYNALLTYAAHSHSQAILNSDFAFGHLDPAGRGPSERARDVGYSGGVSENLIAGGNGPSSVESAHQAFMDSGGHRDNILDVNAKEAGLGHTYDPNKGSTWHGQYTETFCGWNPATLPALPSGIVVPYWGNAQTEFTFLVNFHNAGGYSPTQALVVIDGTPHNMTLRHGSAYNGSYQYKTKLPKGKHSYHFEFIYGAGQSACLPTDGDFDGPDVEVDRAVLEVPAEHNTIKEALAYATTGMIVQVAASTYAETTPLIVPNGVKLIGIGPDRTTVQGNDSGHVLEAHGQSLIEGLSITGSGGGYFESGIWNTSGALTIHNCRFTGNSVGMFSWCFQDDCGAVVTVTNSIFDHNTRTAVDANDPPLHRLINNTIVGNGHGVVLNNQASLAENNIIVQNSGNGLVGNNKNPTVRYNNVWGNDNNYSDLSPGIGSISADPRFVGGNDYHLQAGSPAIDAGNPAPAYNDPDGTRNDMGAFGGPGAMVGYVEHHTYLPVILKKAP